MDAAPYPVPVRVARLDDAAAVTALLCRFRDWWGYDEPSDADMRAAVERLIRELNTDYLLAGDPPVGVAQLRYRFGVWLNAEDCCLEDLYVDEAARGSGVGAALVDAATERARARGCRRIELDVAAGNGPARALYERAGFASPGGETLLMRRRLDR